jgi:hypothetical protein
MADQPETRPKTRPATYALAGIAVLVALALSAQVVRQLGMEVPYDFEVYWNAGHMMAAGEPDLYGWQDGRNEWVFLYPPFFAAMFAPVSWLDLSTACALWMLAQIPLLALCLWGLWRLVDARSFADRALVTAATLVPLFMAFHRNIGWGQVNLLVLAACVWGLAFAMRGRANAGGSILAVGAHVKLLPIALLPVLVILRRFRALLVGCVVGIVLLLTPAVWLVPRLGVVDGVSRSVGVNVEYAQVLLAPRVVSRDAAGMGPQNANNLAPSAVLERATRMGPAARWAGALLGLGMYALALVLCWKRRQEPLMAAGLALVAAVLVQVTVWHYHMVMLAIPLAACAMLHARGRVPRWLLPTACGVLVVGFNFTLSDRLAVLTTLREYGITLLAVLVAWGLLWWAGWRARATQ